MACIHLSRPLLTILILIYIKGQQDIPSLGSTNGVHAGSGGGVVVVGRAHIWRR